MQHVPDGVLLGGGCSSDRQPVGGCRPIHCYCNMHLWDQSAIHQTVLNPFLSLSLVTASPGCQGPGGHWQQHRVTPWRRCPKC